MGGEPAELIIRLKNIATLTAVAQTIMAVLRSMARRRAAGAGHTEVGPGTTHPIYQSDNAIRLRGYVRLPV